MGGGGICAPRAKHGIVTIDLVIKNKDRDIIKLLVLRIVFFMIFLGSGALPGFMLDVGLLKVI